MLGQQGGQAPNPGEQEVDYQALAAELKVQLATANLRIKTLNDDKKRLIAGGAKTLVELQEKKAKLTRIEQELELRSKAYKTLQRQYAQIRQECAAMQGQLEAEQRRLIKELSDSKAELEKMRVIQEVRQPGPMSELLSLQTRTLKSVGFGGMTNTQSMGLGGLAVVLGILGIVGRVD